MLTTVTCHQKPSHGNHWCSHPSRCTWEARGKLCYFDCSQDAGELFSVRQSHAMCAQELLSTLAGSSKILAASCLGADKHQLMTRAETGGGRSPQRGWEKERGSFFAGAGLEPSREQPGKEGGLSGALNRGLNFTYFRILQLWCSVRDKCSFTLS